MKKYLDYSVLPSFLNRYFKKADERLLGPNHDIDSGYFDIIRFFGEKCIDPAYVPITHLPDTYTFSDTQVAHFAADREKEFKAASRLYEGPLVTRAVALQLSSQSSHVTVQPCRYADQAGTCFVLDWPDERFAQSGGTLREYYKRTVPSSLVSDIPFPLCFGVCGFLLVSNQTEPPMLLLMHRSGNLASLERSVGPSMAGAIDYNKGDSTLLQMLLRSAHQEIGEELLLAEHEYQCIPLGHAREVFRGERPQLFCLIITDVPSRIISERLQKGKADASEFTQFDWISLHKDSSPDSAFASLNHEARMCYWLTQEYWETEKSKNR